MRIAVISDIHANLPALEETFKSIDVQDIDAIYCLGDLVGYNIWPNAVITEIKKRRIPTIAGNHDTKAVEIHQYRKGHYNDDEFEYNIIAKKHLQYLAGLPNHIRLEVTVSGIPFNLLMVHGSPYSNKEYLHFHKDDSEFISIFKDVKADMLIFGHTHKPYCRIIADGQSGKEYYAVNVGSVGKPKDGNPKACYAIITIDKGN